MRRYKYNHHVSDHIQRVALIYGNPHSSSNSHNQNQPSYQLNYLNQGNNAQTNNNNGLSPYLQSQLNSIQGVSNSNNNNNLAGIIKRNKYAPSQIIEENVSGISGGGGGRGQQDQMKLPKIGSVGRHLEHNQPSSNSLLPPIGGGSGIGQINGHSILSKNSHQVQ